MPKQHRMNKQARHRGLVRGYVATNPRRLGQQIYAQINLLFSLPGAVSGVTEDIHETLAFPPVA